MANDIKMMLTKWGTPVAGLFFALGPHNWHMAIPFAGSYPHSQLQAFGWGLIAAYLLGMLLNRRK